MDERRLVNNVFASVIDQVYSPYHGPRAPVTMIKLVSVSGQPTEQKADGKMEDGKEATFAIISRDDRTVNKISWRMLLAPLTQSTSSKNSTLNLRFQ